MSKTCILVADRARARFFAPEQLREGAPLSRSVHLKELRAALVDPEGELTGKEMFSNTRSGSNRAPHGAGYEYDDHRAGHREEVERRFARQVASELAKLQRERDFSKLVLAVEPHMLGLLRQALKDKLPASIETHELHADLSWHDPAHIQASLERHGVLSSADHD